jgi:hypothetical protein
VVEAAVAAAVVAAAAVAAVVVVVEVEAAVVEAVVEAAAVEAVPLRRRCTGFRPLPPSHYHGWKSGHPV